MRIAELYRSVQGEGSLTGTPSVFVRASGCNLRCWFCDTPYASWEPEGEDRGVGEILEAILAFDCPHVVLTGGEPMLFAELIPLCELLHEAGKHLTIETAGTLHLPVVCDLMSISPKLANSTPSYLQSPRWHQRHERARQTPEIVQRLIDEYDYQLKFVVHHPEDLQGVLEYLALLASFAPERVWIMPQGVSRSALETISQWLQPWTQEHGFQYCPRKQIEWYGSQRGT